MSYLAVVSGVTTVDCQKQVRSWRLLRSLVELLIPSCNCTTTIMEEDHEFQDIRTHNCYRRSPHPVFVHSTTSIIGTIFGHRRGKVSFCIQTKSTNNPILLLELAVPTTFLAREMRGGLLRIALESTIAGSNTRNSNIVVDHPDSNSDSLFSMPVWRMYCNGRKVGFAIKRRPSKTDLEVLGLMESVVVGAGSISGNEVDGTDQDDIMYLRGNFRRVRGSSDSEMFHLVDPDGNVGQELSIFFLRSC